MIEQDYMMRLIKEMVRAILKLIFHIDTDNPTADLIEDQEEKNTLNELLDMADRGYIDEAENRMYEITAHHSMIHLEMAILFYLYLNEKDDEFLQNHNYSREEIKLGIRDLASRYGISGVIDVFFM